MKIVNISKFVFSVIFFSSLHHNSPAQNDDGSVKNEEPKERKTELGVVAGASLTALIFESSGRAYEFRDDYEMSLNATLGFFCDVDLRSNKWSLSNDLIYNSFNIKGEGVAGAKGSPYQTTASFIYHFIKTHHILRMHLGSKKKFFVGTGLSTGLAFPQKLKYEKTIIPPTLRTIMYPLIRGTLNLGL